MVDESQEDLDKFLNQVDDIHRLVQNLSSDDSKDVSKAMQESDVLLKEMSKTGFDRTSINKSSISAPSPEQQQQMSADAFMAAMEKDAADRAENRRKNKIRADELKVKGNDAFHQQRYDEAIDYYTEGLKIKKDYDILYTNRAQVYVKQGRYEDAISDCDWALKVTPTFIKAFVIKGKCLINLKQFDRAQEEFHHAEEIAKTNAESTNTRRMLEECLEEVQRQREIFQREEAARKFLSNEDASVPMNLTNTLKKLNTDKQPIIYYIGGIDLLNQLIKDEMTRTAFRVQNGFELFNTRTIFIEVEDENLLQSIFQLLTNLSEDDENGRLCLESVFLKNYLAKSRYSSIALQYLVEISLKNHLRMVLMEKINSNKLIQQLLKIIKENKTGQIFAAKLLSNLAIESRIKQSLNNETDLQICISILKSSSKDEQLQSVMFSLLTNLCSEKNIRLYVLDRTDLLRVLVENLEKTNDESQSNLLGLLINITNERNDALQIISKKLCETTMIKLKNSPHHQRIFTLLGNLAMHYEEIIDVLVQYQIIGWVSQASLQNPNEDVLRASIRLLALCTKSNEQAQQTMANDHKLLAVISEQFLKSQNSLLIGNASLAFGHIVLHPSARTFFQKSIGIERIIRQLLKLVEESWLSKPARKNVAIFLTKLVKVDESFLQEFRNQHGTEILHSALKDVDL